MDHRELTQAIEAYLKAHGIAGVGPLIDAVRDVLEHRGLDVRIECHLSYEASVPRAMKCDAPWSDGLTSEHHAFTRNWSRMRSSNTSRGESCGESHGQHDDR